MGNKVKIGIIGVGWMGSEHGRNIISNPKAELTAVSDANDKTVQQFLLSADHSCSVYENYMDLLQSDIDAVIIASSNAAHAEMTIAAAKLGKHIYCEKPMANTLEDCARVRDAVEAAGVSYLIGYHRRLNPLYLQVKRYLEDGRFGQPTIIESEYNHHVPGDWDIWSWLGKKSIAGSIFHGGCGHNVDLLRYMGGDIEEVFCFKDICFPRTVQIETEDTAVAVYRFTSGAIGKVQLSLGPVLPFTFGFRLIGTKGTVINNRIWFDDIPRFDQPGHEQDCIKLPDSWIPDNVQGGVSEPWKAQMDHFIDIISEQTPSMNDVHSAFETSKAVFAALESAETGKAVKIRDMKY